MKYSDPIFSNEEKNKFIRVSKKIDKIMNVVCIILFIIILMDNIAGDTRIGIKNAKKTEGVILEINYGYRYMNERYHSIISLLDVIFDIVKADISVKYEVNDVEYVLNEKRTIIAIDWDQYDGQNVEGWEVGDKVKVLYDEENPENAAVDKIEFYEIVLYFATFVVMLICIYIKYKDIKRSKI